jgi:hypothetical protein
MIKKKTFEELQDELDPISMEYIGQVGISPGPGREHWLVGWALMKNAWDHVLRSAGWTDEEFMSELERRVDLTLAATST